MAAITMVLTQDVGSFPMVYGRKNLFSHSIGYGTLATKRHFFLVVAIYTNSVHTDYSIKTYKTAILKFSIVSIKKCYLTKLYKIKIVTNL